MRLEQVTPSIGANVFDVRLDGDPSAELLASLGKALDDHLVLFVRNQDALEPEAFLALGRALGTPEVSPNLRNMGGDLEAIHWIETDGSHPRGGFADVWHSDLSWSPEPPSHVMLRPEILPALGGDTLWVNLEAAYAALDPRLRDIVDGLEALHRVETTEAHRNNRNIDNDLLANVPDYYHTGTVQPVVRVHPVTGRRSLYVNPAFTRRIVGMSASDGGNLLRLLFDHCLLPEFQLRFRWEPDVIVMWDNRATMHYAVNDYNAQRRHWRLTISGEGVKGIAD